MRLVPTLMIAGGTLAAGAFLACGRSRPAAAMPATPASLQGQVLEVLEAAPYTYLRLRTAQGELWTAVPAAPVKPGDPVTVLAQVRMDNFQSATLHRTFPAVYMGTLAGAGPASAAAPAATAMPPAAMPPAAMAAMAAPAPGHGSGPAHGAAPFAPTAKVPRAAGPEGHTIAELYARQDSLKDRPVAVRARILRYMPGIMGKTWIHLADGSGKPETRDFDLTVTTQDAAKVGDVVTVKGLLHLKRDVGAGYVYPVIIEDAKLAR
jgi:hypothetical protein